MIGLSAILGRREGKENAPIIGQETPGGRSGAVDDLCGILPTDKSYG